MKKLLFALTILVGCKGNPRNHLVKNKLGEYCVMRWDGKLLGIGHMYGYFTDIGIKYISDTSFDLRQTIYFKDHFAAIRWLEIVNHQLLVQQKRDSIDRVTSRRNDSIDKLRNTFE